MKIFAALLLCALFGASPSLGMKEISVEPIEYTDVDGFLLEGYKSMPIMDNMPEKVPAVVIIPDWDGVNRYEEQRATLIAELGYIGFAADIYGINDHIVDDLGRRRELATLYRTNVTLFVQRIKAAINLVKTFDGVDPDNVAVIGYCFGGTGVLVRIVFSGSYYYTFIQQCVGLMRISDLTLLLFRTIFLLLLDTRTMLLPDKMMSRLSFPFTADSPTFQILILPSVQSCSSFLEATTTNHQILWIWRILSRSPTPLGRSLATRVSNMPLQSLMILATTFGLTFVRGIP